MKHFQQTIEFRLILVLLAFVFAGVSFADDYKYSDSWGKQGFQLKNQKTTGVEVTHSIQSFAIITDLINGKAMNLIQLPGNFLPNNEGAPDLPGTGRYIAIPQGAIPHLKVSAIRTEKFTNIELAPAFRIPWDTETGPLEYNQDANIYSKNEFYPANPVIISEVTQIRGIDVMMLGITPFQYNPVTKELIVYRDIEVSIDFEGGNGHFGENRLRSRWWDPLFEDMLLNYESLPKMDYSRSYQATDDVGCDYLIITPNGAEFQQWADSIKRFRTLQGIMTDVMTLDEVGGNNAATIENFINNAYNNWDIVPAACLLLGDYGNNAANSITSPIWDGYCVSDNIYADVTNNDMPDIVFARITAQNATHLETMVTKFLDYERTPPTDPYFYDHPITALGFQTERWFQICSEAVAGFWEEVQGKSTVRVNKTYQGNPMSDPWSTATNTSTVVNLFGPNGLGYIPSTPAQVNCTWNGTATNVVTAINNGSFMLQHRDHGYEQGWGEPAFISSNINSLNNTDLTFVWSINCLTGKYNMSGECFTEKFHRYTYNGQNAGALGLNAASEVSYSFVNDAYAWGAFDNMWPDFLPTYGTTPASRDVMPAFGQAAGKYFLQQSSWPYNTGNKEVTYNLFHHHGDAFMTVYSEVPQNLTVVHNPIIYAGVTSFDITANAGAFIALTVNGEIIGTAVATGGPVSITIPAQQPPDQMLVTITKQNFYRYESFVGILPPAGPYIVQNAVEIDDAAGNGNGIMETAESILATVTIENVGIEAATNVVVTINSDDEYITITDNSESYGNIAAGATASIENAFAWDVANNIPDMHMVIFELNATDGTDTWTTFFGVEGHGPIIVFGGLTIDDSQGNDNGRLDPGETVDVIIPTYNNGSYHAIGAIGTLSSSSGFLTLNTYTYDFNVIGSGLMEEAIFNVSVAPNAPVGTSVNLIYNVTSGGYQIQESFGTSIGLIVEDWETGDMGQFSWLTGGSNSWVISQQNPYEGAYCSKSGTIGHNQNTWISLEYDIFSNDSISFWFKVSSELGYDYLKFYIDNIQLSQWSGEVGWQRAAYAVTSGTHTFKWTYSKDQGVVSGSDCAWIDFIVLPAPPMTTAYAGQDDVICEENNYQCEGTATLYNLVNWSSSGSGSFDNSQNLIAVYTPSPDDISAGSVILTLTAYGPDNNVTDNMTLTIQNAAVANAGEDVTVCNEDSFELADATAENYVSVQWVTTGDGTFDDMYIINPVYTPGTSDIETGTVTLTFTVTGNEPCGSATDNVVLTLINAATAFAGENSQTCSDTPLTITTATAENYTSVEWSTSGDGTFNDYILLNPVYTPGINDAINGTVTLTLTAFGMGTCPSVSSAMEVVINAVATAYAGADNQINSNVTYTLSDAVAENYTSVTWTTSGDGTFDNATIIHPTYTPGTNDINAEEVILTLTAGNEACGEISDDMVLAVNSLSINENLAGWDVSFYPNPSNGSFTFDISSENSDLITIRIYNSLSKLVYEAENIEVDKTFTQTIQLNVEQGVYLIRIEGKTLLVNRKMIIN